MAKSGRKTPGATGRPSAPGLRLAEPSSRVGALRKERERLLREIARRRREVEKLAARIEDALTRARVSLAPLLGARERVEEELHAAFARLLTPGRLSKRRRAELQRIYRALQAEGWLEARSEPHEGAAHEPEPPSGDPRAARSGSGGYSAPRPAESALPSLRQLFRRLAIALHPDRVQHHDEKERRTEAMKELTHAYERGDLARLLEIEREWAARDRVEGAARPDHELEAIERTVAELKVQLRSVLDELRELRSSEPYRMARELEESGGLDPLIMVAAEMQAELARLRELRDLLTALAARRISWDAFVRGQEADEELDFQQAERAFDRLLHESMAANAPPTGTPGRRARPSRRGR